MQAAGGFQKTAVKEKGQVSREAQDVVPILKTSDMFFISKGKPATAVQTSLIF